MAWAAALVGLWVVAVAIWTLRDLLFLTFLAILFAVLLRAASDALADRTGLPARGAVFAVVLVLLGAVALAVTVLVPPLVQQSRDLLAALPGIADTLQKRVSDTPFLSDAWAQAQSQFNLPSPGSVLAQVGRVFGLVSASLSNLVFLFFTILFLALSPATYIDGLRWLMPPDERGFTLRLLDELGGTLRSWFGGQLLLMAMVAIVSWLGLMAIGVPYSLALGVFAGLMDFIPYLGPLLGAAPAVLVALSISPTAGLWAVLLFVVVQQLEGNIVGPVVQKSAVAIPPALLLVFLFGMGQVFGVTGLLVATPLLAVLIVVVKRIYVERCLEGVDKAGQSGG